MGAIKALSQMTIAPRWCQVCVAAEIVSPASGRVRDRAVNPGRASTYELFAGRLTLFLVASEIVPMVLRCDS